MFCTSKVIRYTQMPARRLLLTAEVGNRLPENALTSYYSLAPLLKASRPPARPSI